MPCIPLPYGGFLCVPNDPVPIEHGGKTYQFEWTAACGWMPVNKDGSERRSRVLNAVWDELMKTDEYRRRMDEVRLEQIRAKREIEKGGQS